MKTEDYLDISTFFNSNNNIQFITLYMLTILKHFQRQY